MLFWLSARYCARQDATAFIELWALLLVLIAAAVVTRKRSRVYSGTLVVFAALTAAYGSSIFYGCSMTAANEQGLGSDLAASTFNILRCLGNDALGTATGWALLVVLCLAAIALLVLGVVRWKALTRVLAFAGSAVLLILTFALAFFLVFGFSWCTSQRLI